MPGIAQLQLPQIDASTACIDIRNIRTGEELWAKICNLEQFWEMFNERYQALGGTPALPIPEAGCDCQYMGMSPPASVTGDFSVAYLQHWLEDNCHNFVRSHDENGDPYEPGYYHGASTITMWSAATLHQVKADWLNALDHDPPVSATGFYRLLPDGSTDYGVADGTGGDYFYHPLWNELYAFMRLLVWTLEESAFDNHGEQNQKISGVPGVFYETVTIAYEIARDGWAFGTLSSSSDNPTASEEFRDLGPGNEPTRYNVLMTRRYQYGEFTGLPTFAAHAMDVYVFSGVVQIGSGTGLNVYADHGDGPPYLQDFFALHETLDEDTIAARTTSRVGSVEASITNAPQQGPGLDSPPGTRQYGWEEWVGISGTGAQHPMGVLRWNVEGGFEYL